MPAPAEALVGLAKLRRRCCALGILRLEAGPKAVALEFRDDAALCRAGADLAAAGADLRIRERRLIVSNGADRRGVDLPGLRRLLERVEVSMSAEACRRDG